MASVLKIINSIFFHVKRPFVLTAFFYRERRRNYLYAPRLWLNSRMAMNLDLNYYEPENEGQKLNILFADNILSVKKDINSEMNKASSINILIIIFLICKFSSIDLDISAMGISFKDTKGLSEILLIISIFLSFNLNINSRRVYVLNSYLSYIIKNKLEPELMQFYKIKYLTTEYYGRYIPYNLPFVTINGITNYFMLAHSAIVVLMFSILLLVYYYLYSFALYSIYIRSDLGYISDIIVYFAIVINFYFIIYFIDTRLPLPFRDFSNGDKLAIAEQFFPSELNELRSSLFSQSIKDRMQLEEQGYLKKRSLD